MRKYLSRFSAVRYLVRHMTESVGRIEWEREREKSNRVWVVWGSRQYKSSYPLASSEGRRETIPNWIILVSNNRRAKLKYREHHAVSRAFAPPRILRVVINVCTLRIGVYRMQVYVHVSVETEDAAQRLYPLCVRVLVLRGDGEDHASRAAIPSCTSCEK